MNRLYLGDCLRIIRSKISSESIDLIYLDPPFNSGRNYGEFNDVWPSMEDYIEFVKLRVIECHRVLKKTGSLYLHCDPTSSHYLKIMLDHIFGAGGYRNEIVWCYSGGGISKNNYPKKHDVIFRYSKSDDYLFNVEYKPYKENTQKVGKHSTLSKGDTKIDLQRGTPVTDWWTDIKTVTGWAMEKMGYPTQKPEALLRRIILASSNAGDTVLDPFCGCGTCVAIAEKEGRKWVGIDNNKKAIALTRKRIKEIRRQKGKRIEL